MEDLTELLGLPQTVLANGTEWTFSPVTLGDVAHMQEQAKIKFNSDKKAEAKFVAEGMKEAGAPAVTVFSAVESVLRRRRGMLDGLDGTDEIAEIAKMSLEKKHPGITDEEIAPLLTAKSALRILELCGLGKDDDKEDGEDTDRDAKNG